MGFVVHVISVFACIPFFFVLLNYIILEKTRSHAARPLLIGSGFALPTAARLFRCWRSCEATHRLAGAAVCAQQYVIAFVLLWQREAKAL